ncbi:DNA topoisomerase VI subunit B, partial [archaeon]|nr:DNA topoisomerase VI subunit B [archaeon]
PNVFGKLLYGSKFFKLAQTRGQQGLGVSMSVLYSQLTTGKSTKIISRIAANKPSYYYEIQIDTNKNVPIILKEDVVEFRKEHGTKVEIEIQARYQKGKQSIEEYLKQTAIANPHAMLAYISPENERIEFPRAVSKCPAAPVEIKPHPYGVELGTFMAMLGQTKSRTLQGFFTDEFCRIGPSTAREICAKAGLKPKEKPKNINKEQIEGIYSIMQKTRVIAPPTNCLSPITEPALREGIKKEFGAEFIGVRTRAPSVYRGFPFLIEVAIAYDSTFPKEEQIRLVRLGNRVPLLYQQGACAITECVADVNWRAYGLQQSAGSLPFGPVIVVVHMASVWVPFTSEAKEAIAHYPEIIKEIKLCLQECGRDLGIYLRKTIKAKEQKEKIGLFEKYIPELASSLASLVDGNKSRIEEGLSKVLKKNMKALTDNEQTK